eukprot:13816495-Heterocapsa_arctica.AAC.1
MRSEVGTSHANETNKKLKILVVAHVRHGVATIGFHPRALEVSIGASRNQNIRLLNLASTLAVPLGLGLGRGTLLSL